MLTATAKSEIDSILEKNNVQQFLWSMVSMDAFVSQNVPFSIVSGSTFLFIEPIPWVVFDTLP